MMKDSFMAACVARAGMRRGADICTFVLCWWTTMREHEGRDITVEEYADFWKVSRATAYREQQRFRDAWPEFDTPAAVAEALDLDVMAPSIPSLMTVRAPRLGHA